MRKAVLLCASLLATLVLILIGCSTLPPLAEESTAVPGGEQTAVSEGQPTDAPTERVRVRWFIGLDTGKDSESLAVAESFAEGFNTSQSDLELVLEVVSTDSYVAVDALKSRIEAGDPPDIAGPADSWGVHQLTDDLLSLDFLLASYDLSDVTLHSLDSWQVEGRLIGLPVGVYPSMIYYNRDLFDAAGLAYPPHRYGAPYADGDAWTIEKMQEIALLLTLDANGNNATSVNFDPGHIVQWGFHWQWDSTRSMASLFGAGSVVDEDGNATIPDHWREAFHWYYDGMWEEYFIPTGRHVASLEYDPFNSGQVAMVHTFLWYLPYLSGVANWDLAAVPSYEGVVTPRMQQDIFIILNTTEHPADAVELAHTLATTPELLGAWGMVPAFESLQAGFFAEFEARHPGVDWQVVLDSLDYADNSYASDMPNYREAYDRLLKFRDLMTSRDNVDLDVELDRLESDLQVIFAEEE